MASSGSTNQKYFTSRLREITRHVGNIFTAESEKARYLQNLLSRNIYNLENIAPAFKNIPEEEGGGRLCCFHGFGKFAAYHCALRNANKLKRWILMQKSRVCYDSCSDSTQENWESDDDSEVYEKTNLGTSQRPVKEEEEHHEQENKYLVILKLFYGVCLTESCKENKEDENATLSDQNIEEIYNDDLSVEMVCILQL